MALLYTIEDNVDLLSNGGKRKLPSLKEARDYQKHLYHFRRKNLVEGNLQLQDRYPRAALMAPLAETSIVENPDGTATLYVTHRTV